MKNFRPSAIHFILILYIVFLIFGGQLASDSFFVNIIKPVFLTALAFYAYKKSDNYHGRFRNVNDNAKLMIIMAIVYILVFSLSGMLVGFSYSIYSHHFVMILKNIYQMTFIIVLVEYLRSYLINLNSKSKLGIVTTTLIFILMEVNFGVLGSKLADSKSAFEYIASIILPLIASNALFSQLALKGGYKLTIPYRVVISLFLLLTPVMPAFDWFLTGAFGVIFPAVVFMVMRKYSKKPTAIRREHKKTTSAMYFICLGLMLIFILFVYGLFRYKPIVILSNSMSPGFNKGDVAIYYEPSEEEKRNLDINTIVVYTKDSQYVVHRIVRKIKKSGEIMYITRGDANTSDDFAPVSTDEIVGIFATSVKYVGYPSVWLNQLFNQQNAVVETK